MSDTRDALIETIANRLDLQPLDEAEVESVLALAAAAAHGTGDRTSAPLVAFLAGLATARGGKRADMLDQVRRLADAITASRNAIDA